MKKFNLLKKNKLWLASLGLATTGSLVLAACASNNTTPSNNSNNTNNNSGQSNQNNTDETTNNQTPEPSTPTVPQATETQLAAARTLLQNEQIKTVLTNNKNFALAKIEANLLTVNEVGTFSQETVKDAKAALGETNAAVVSDVSGTNAQNASVMALINTLESQLKAAETKATVVPADKKDQFNAAVSAVKTQATNLLTKLNALPTTASAETNVLNAAKKGFEEALKTYSTATAATLTTTWTALKKAHEEYQAKLNEVTPKLIDAQKSGFDLDQATSELETFINTDVATFLSDATDGSKHSSVLNALVAKVRTSVLGTPGYDLWVAGDAPKGIETGDNKKPSTQLYAIVVGLANQTAAWNSLNDAVKTLTFNQNLSLDVASAVNVLALHLTIPVPVDVSRLNAYLTLDQSNVVKILHATDTNIATTLETLAKGVNQYATLLSGTGTDTLVQKLTTLETAVTDDARKAKVTALKTAAEGLVTKFATFKTEWDKLQPTLWTTTGTTTTYPLLESAANLNQLIGLANHYDDVLQVVGQAQSLRALVTQITTAVKAVPSDMSQATQQAPLMHALQQIITDVSATSDNSFGKALTEFATETGWTGTNKTSAEALAKSTTADSTTTKTGLIYTDLVEGVAATTGDSATPAKLSFTQLKTELEKLQTGTNKKLEEVLGLLNQQLKPSDGSQTTRLNNHLAAMFNNGDVLPKSEMHN
ncbi:hypothetical protein J2Z62_000413 [Mycoplasmoides fastidiosum]|uniref:Lipoprotein n=1 Tax=Mycoplasmoides fastidiosum TaxID=92758 RepID=A0ABU0LZF9_9BACT|nr:hypothetical protein [Mycoplasmoides fastidiosum]MDQ0513975.1 hypothetical protein [Mycoplasmoides fastidiosum]UUD37611.1 hypothetical protein NPA10_03525 [Mycoplasmoides fastidiosum]